MSVRFRPIGSIVALAMAACAQSAVAQSKLPTITIGSIKTEKACTLYEESAGRSAVVATRNVIAASESWRTWLVRDCVDNFATIRTSLQAALASSGKFAIKTQGSAYTLSGTVSQVGGDPGPAPNAPPSGDGFSISSRSIFVSMEVTLRDSSGRIVYGGLLTKHLETGSSIKTQGQRTSNSQSGEAVYTELQNQVALAVARLVAFRITPLKVVANDDGEIRLNYGSPLLTLGSIIQATSPDGGAMVRYSVTSSDPNESIAKIDQERAGGAKITPGSVASVIEDDDASANRRRTSKVELPE